MWGLEASAAALFLPFTWGMFTAHGKSKWAETHLLQGKYFYTSLVSHKLLLYQTSHIKSWTSSLLPSNLRHSGKRGDQIPTPQKTFPTIGVTRKSWRFNIFEVWKQSNKTKHKWENLGAWDILYSSTPDHPSNQKDRDNAGTRVSSVREWRLSLEGRAPKLASREGHGFTAGRERSRFCFTTRQSHREMHPHPF